MLVLQEAGTEWLLIRPFDLPPQSPPELSYFLSSNKHDHPSRLGQLPYVLQLPRDQTSLDNQLMTLLPPLRHPLVSIKAAAFLEVDCCTG